MAIGATAVGWFISSSQANSREIRKEKRSEVDACCELAADILEKSRTYFGRDPDEESPGEAADLSFSVKRLARRLQRLERQHDGFKVSEAGGDLFEAVTGGDFEGAGRTKKGPADAQIRRIEESVHRAIDDLETGFEREFKTWRQLFREWRKERKSWRV